MPQRVRADEVSPVTFYRRNMAGGNITGTVRYRVDGGAWKECAANTKESVISTGIRSGEHQPGGCLRG